MYCSFDVNKDIDLGEGQKIHFNSFNLNQFLMINKLKIDIVFIIITGV